MNRPDAGRRVRLVIIIGITGAVFIAAAAANAAMDDDADDRARQASAQLRSALGGIDFTTVIPMDLVPTLRTLVRRR